MNRPLHSSVSLAAGLVIGASLVAAFVISPGWLILPAALAVLVGVARGYDFIDFFPEGYYACVASGGILASPLLLRVVTVSPDTDMSGLIIGAIVAAAICAAAAGIFLTALGTALAIIFPRRPKNL